MGASEKAVAAVMETLGCEEHDHHERPFCETEHHLDEPWFRERWGDRGCEFAARLADAAVDTDRPSIQAQAMREAARTSDNSPDSTIREWLRLEADRIEAQ